MGFGGISPMSLILILLIVILLFGTKRLRSMGSDLGNAFKSFKTALKDSDNETESLDNNSKNTNANADGRVIDSEAKRKENV